MFTHHNSQETQNLLSCSLLCSVLVLIHPSLYDLMTGDHLCWQLSLYWPGASFCSPPQYAVAVGRKLCIYSLLHNNAFWCLRNIMYLKIYQMSKCFIHHNIFKYMIFKGVKRCYYWVNGLDQITVFKFFRGRSIVVYMVGNVVLWRGDSGALKRDLLPYIQR